MKAGRELDARIDAEIFGVERKLCTIHHAYSCCGRTTKHYSTQIADAMLVVKKLEERGLTFILWTTPRIAQIVEQGIDGGYLADENGDTLEHAICLAALAVVERRG